MLPAILFFLFLLLLNFFTHQPTSTYYLVFSSLFLLQPPIFVRPSGPPKQNQSSVAPTSIDLTGDVDMDDGMGSSGASSNFRSHPSDLNETNAPAYMVCLRQVAIERKRREREESGEEIESKRRKWRKRGSILQRQRLANLSVWMLAAQTTRPKHQAFSSCRRVPLLCLSHRFPPSLVGLLRCFVGII